MMPLPRSTWLDRRSRIFLGLIATSILLYSKPVAALWRISTTSDEYSHILLVLPISLSLAYLEGRHLKLQPRYAVLAGGVPLLLSLLVCYAFVDRLGTASQEAAAVFSLVVFWLASVFLVYGPQVGFKLRFALCFLFLLVPVPLAWLDRAIVFLQQASTTASCELFKLAGIPVMRDGFVLSLPLLQIQVAKECSGIRTSEMLLITGLTLAHLSLRSFWSKLAFVLLIIPMAVAKNAIRIFTLSVLGMYVNIGFLNGPLHHRGGIVFFAVAIGVLLLVLNLLQRLENRIAPKLLPTSPPLRGAGLSK